MDVKETGQTLLGNNFVQESREKSDLTKDDFLKLLLAQMQNQDPLAPQDSKEYLSQLAQLSSLEELQNLNDSISTMSILQAASNNSQTVNYIGKTITAGGNEFSVTTPGKTDVELIYKLEGNAESCDITISDENGKVVRTIKGGAQSSGEHTVEWDGLDDSGNPLPAGKYKFDVAAVDGDGAKLEPVYMVKGKVTGITYENGYPELLMGETRVALGNVVSVDNQAVTESENNLIFANIQPNPITKFDTEKLYTAKAASKNTFNVKQ